MGDADENELIWKNDTGSFAIRFQGELENGRPALDEIVATGASLHLEQMDHDQWWMGIQAGGRDVHLWFTLENGCLCIRLTDQQDETEWEGDNRPKSLRGIDE